MFLISGGHAKKATKNLKEKWLRCNSHSFRIILCSYLFIELNNESLPSQTEPHSISFGRNDNEQYQKVFSNDTVLNTKLAICGPDNNN